jgi:hypothetical protein
LWKLHKQLADTFIAVHGASMCLLYVSLGPCLDVVIKSSLASANFETSIYITINLMQVY